MKHNSKQFLALFMAVSMAVAPVSGVYAEDQNAAVEDTLSENKQDSDEVGQTEPEATVGQTELEAAAGQTESSVTTDTSQEVTKEAGKNQLLKRYRIRRKTEPPHRRNQSAKTKYLRTLLISAVWQVL